MKKSIIKVILIVIVVTSVASYLYTYRQDVVQGIVGLIASQLDKEREKDVGQYNIVNWNDGLFQINHSLSEDRLELIGEDYSVVLLKDISHYRIKKHTLYITANDGYAIIDENDNARILITEYDELDQYSLEYEIIQDNRRIIYSKCYNDEHIEYLDNFNQFSENEQKQLGKL